MAQTAEERKEKKRARGVAYRATHKEEIAASSAAYRASHREEIRAYHAARWRANPIKKTGEDARRAAEMSATWRKVNPGRNAATKKVHYQHNRELVLARNAAWRSANRAWVLNFNHAYHMTNREKIAAQHLAYSALHREQVGAASARHRARKLGAAISDLTRTQWDAIKATFGQRCVYCGEKPKRLTQDHLIPLSKGGDHTASNIVPACKPCNSRKYNGPPLVSVQPVLLA